jgi:hypothetical protein
MTLPGGSGALPIPGHTQPIFPQLKCVRRLTTHHPCAESLQAFSDEPDRKLGMARSNTSVLQRHDLPLRAIQ